MLFVFSFKELLSIFLPKVHTFLQSFFASPCDRVGKVQLRVSSKLFMKLNQQPRVIKVKRALETISSVKFSKFTYTTTIKEVPRKQYKWGDERMIGP